MPMLLVWVLLDLFYQIKNSIKPRLVLSKEYVSVNAMVSNENTCLPNTITSLGNYKVTQEKIFEIRDGVSKRKLI